MPSVCSVLNCGMRANRDKVRFFRIPAVLQNAGESRNRLSQERRELWISALKRGPLSDGQLKYGRICSRHFISGAPAELGNKDNPDWIPNKNMGYFGLEEAGAQKGKRAKYQMDQQIEALNKDTPGSSREEERTELSHPVDDPTNTDFLPSRHLNEYILKSRSKRRYPSITGCCALQCAGNKEPGTNFYNFPQSLLLINMWKAALKIARIQDVTNLYVCNYHFDDRDFISGTKELKKMAIPSVQRNDEKHPQIQPVPQRPSANCSCKCTCASKPIDRVRSFHNYSKSIEKPLDTVQVGSKPNEENSSNKSEISRLNKFEETEIRDGTVVVCDKVARVVINSEINSLRVKLVKEVKRILGEDGSQNVAVLLGNTYRHSSQTPQPKKDVLKDLRPDSQKNNNIGGVYVSQEGKVSNSQDFNLGSPELRKKFKEMAKPFGTKCPYCGFKEYSALDLVYHVKRVHYAIFPEGPLSTDDVYRELIKQTEILQKEEEEFPTYFLNSYYKVYCQYCGEYFKDIQALIVHVKAIHETSCGPLPLSETQLISGMRNCKFCNRILNDSKEYESHVARCILNPAVKGDKETQVCEFCGISGSRDVVKSHKARHHDPREKKTFFCEVCGRTLSRLISYRHHMLRHENKRVVKCPEEGCNKTFNTPAGLQNHKLSHLPSDLCKFVCKVCDKRFSSRRPLLKHQGTHYTAQCQWAQCKKFFKGKLELQAHVLKKHPYTRVDFPEGAGVSGVNKRKREETVDAKKLRTDDELEEGRNKSRKRDDLSNSCEELSDSSEETASDEESSKQVRLFYTTRPTNNVITECLDKCVSP